MKVNNIIFLIIYSFILYHAIVFFNKKNNSINVSIYSQKSISKNKYNEEANIFYLNQEAKEALKYSKSYFYKSMSDTFYLRGGKIIHYETGRTYLMNLIDEYYEIFIYKIPERREKFKKYNFDHLYLLTPDTIYKLRVEPLIYKVKPI